MDLFGEEKKEPEVGLEAPTDALEAPTDALEAPTDALEAPTDALEAPTDAPEAVGEPGLEAPTDAALAPTTPEETAERKEIDDTIILKKLKKSEKRLSDTEKHLKECNVRLAKALACERREYDYNAKNEKNISKIKNLQQQVQLLTRQIQECDAAKRSEKKVEEAAEKQVEEAAEKQVEETAEPPQQFCTVKRKSTFFGSKREDSCKVGVCSDEEGIKIEKPEKGKGPVRGVCKPSGGKRKSRKNKKHSRKFSKKQIGGKKKNHKQSKKNNRKSNKKSNKK